MASGKLYNLARMTTTTTGTGTITLASAVAGFLSFATADAVNGEVITYAIREGSNTEIGYGTYSSTGPTLTRTVLKSTNANSAINLSGAAEVAIVAAAENFFEWFRNVDANGFNLQFDDNTGILDDSGNELLIFQKTASAVNQIDVTNAAAGSSPSIAATGGDTNIDLTLAGKGTGGLIGAFKSGTGLRVKDTGNDHYAQIAINENLTANRTLNVVLGNADRTLTLSGNATLGIPASVQVFTSSGTWTKPTGCTAIRATIVAGGGGGGAPDAVAANLGIGVGGGGGACSIEWIDVTAVSSVAVTIGAGGAGGTSSTSAGDSGTAGGNSVFGTYMTVAGGAGGGFSAASTTVNALSGAAGGSVVTAGDVSIPGGAGQICARLSGSIGFSGNGGDSFLGRGGRGVSQNLAGIAATGYGAGGSGGVTNSATPRNGAAGTGGICIVEEFYG